MLPQRSSARGAHLRIIHELEILGKNRHLSTLGTGIIVLEQEMTHSSASLIFLHSEIVLNQCNVLKASGTYLTRFDLQEIYHLC